jgi:methylglutaconyl-CoA hydratase
MEHPGTPSPPLRIVRRRSTAWVILDRPDVHNAFDDEVVGELRRTADALGRETDVRVVVLAGEGASFSAGADLRWMQRMVAATEEENRADAEAMARMFEAWYRLPKPVVGRIQGAALGGGVGLTAVCDIAVAARDTVFGFTEVRLGILPAVISPFVLAKIGQSAARDLFLTGERFSADRAREIGLVHSVVLPEELDAEVDRVVEQLLAGGPDAQARVKRLLPLIEGKSPEDARETTTRNIAEARAGAEGQEGIQAFLDRRPAAWRRDS